MSKPLAIKRGDAVGVFAPSSPGDGLRMEKGLRELQSLGYVTERRLGGTAVGYFAAPADDRVRDFLSLFQDDRLNAIFALRGGYGSNYLLDQIAGEKPPRPKCVVGFSDLTSLQIFLWQSYRWVCFYGPMVAAGFDGGANAPNGYDQSSFEAALTESPFPRRLDLQGEALRAGTAEGTVLGGCMTLVETTLGTPWELDTSDAILLLEDRGMKPWQVDRALMHLLQAEKFRTVRGIVLGEFPECEPPVDGSPTVREVCERILAPLGIPIVYGAAVGHTPRPMLTVPLGIQARLYAEGSGAVEFMESAVVS